MSERILLECDECHKSTDVDQIEWSPDGATAVCLDCVANRPIDPPKQTHTSHYPLFMLYKEGRLLHITSDLATANQWQTFQGERWWFYSVDSIFVKFFESRTQASFVEKRLTHDLAPRYGVKPDPEKDLDGEEFKIYWADEETDKKNLEKTLNTRISREMWMALSAVASSEGVRRTDWVRSALYEALRASQAGA